MRLLRLIWYGIGDYGAHSHKKEKHLHFILKGLVEAQTKQNIQFGAVADIYMAKK